MNQSPADILAAIKASVDGMLQSVDRRIHALASGLEILSKLDRQNDARMDRLERAILMMLTTQNPPSFAERQAMADEIRAGINERVQQRKAMLDALRTEPRG
jgi:flagellar basal body-associated protein FliL